MKSHRSGLLSFALGGIVCKLSKQKLNTKSSTKAELVGANDHLPSNIRVQMFLAEQGYVLDKKFLEQDNKSAIRLEKKGRVSAGQKSRYINVGYFWSKNRVDYLGACRFLYQASARTSFPPFCDVILGYCNVNALAHNLSLVLEEPVEQNKEEEGNVRV
jgi:hypothetical protein